MIIIDPCIPLLIFSGIIHLATASEVLVQVGNVTTDLLANVQCFLSTPELNAHNDGTKNDFNCLSAAWPSATIPYMWDSSLKNSWRAKIEKITRELSQKTCLRFISVTGGIQGYNGSRLMRLRPGNSSKFLSQIPPLNVNISSWGTMASDLVNSLCVFHQGARLDREGRVRYNDSESGLDCLSRDSGRGMSSQQSYIGMLDAEKLNVLYNCGGCHSYQFFPNVLLPRRKSRSKWKTFLPYLVHEDHSGGFGLGVCRGYVSDQLAVGRLKVSKGGRAECLLPYGGKERSLLQAFEVLAVHEMEHFHWLPVLDEPVLPPYVIPAGRTSKGDTHYVGKCSVAHEEKTVTVLGKIHGHDPTVMYYGYEGDEHKCSQYDVFACNGAVDSRQTATTSPLSWDDASNFIFYYPPNTSMAYKIKRRRQEKSLGFECSDMRCLVDKEVPLCFGKVDAQDGFPYYVTISDGKSFLGTSLEIEGQCSRIVTKKLRSIAENQAFHWYITRENTFFQFINRQTGMVLDSNDESSVYVHAANGGSFQDWKIEPWRNFENSKENIVCQRIRQEEEEEEEVVDFDRNGENSTEESESDEELRIRLWKLFGIGDNDDSDEENDGSGEEGEGSGEKEDGSGEEDEGSGGKDGGRLARYLKLYGGEISDSEEENGEDGQKPDRRRLFFRKEMISIDASSEEIIFKK